jgi:hypothetical protein
MFVIYKGVPENSREKNPSRNGLDKNSNIQFRRPNKEKKVSNILCSVQRFVQFTQMHPLVQLLTKV